MGANFTDLTLCDTNYIRLVQIDLKMYYEIIHYHVACLVLAPVA